MKHVHLGRSGLKVSNLCLGTMNFGPHTTEQDSFALMDKALELGELHGFRNAQTTVVAPTGTIGLVMDCDTTGIEPDFALVKFKKLAGGGYWKIINRAVPEALRALGYRESDIAEIEAYAVGHGSLSNAPAINVSTLAMASSVKPLAFRVETLMPGALESEPWPTA